MPKVRCCASFAQKTNPRRFVTKVFFADDFQRHRQWRSTRRSPLEVKMRSTTDAIARGIETIYQDSGLVVQLSRLEVCFLGANR
jgi:hypothetical protein